MLFQKAVVEAATAAVLRYRSMSRSGTDNAVSRSFLRGFVAERLFERLDAEVHVDRPAAVMALELGMRLERDLMAFLGSACVDVAVYAGDAPSQLLQLEVFDTAAHIPPGNAAVDRADFLARATKAEAFIAYMVCPFVIPLENRIERLHDLYGGHMYVGERHASLDARWQWCFVCASLGERRRSP